MRDSFLIALFSVFALSGTAFADRPASDGRRILKINKVGNLKMAYADLAEGGEFDRIGGGGAKKQDLDVVTFPECGRNKRTGQVSKNKMVDAIRVWAPKRKQYGPNKGTDNTFAYIKTVSLIFDNGGVQKITINTNLRNWGRPAATPFYPLIGGKRCIRAIAINGEESEANPGRFKNAQVFVVGRR